MIGWQALQNYLRINRKQLKLKDWEILRSKNQYQYWLKREIDIVNPALVHTAEMLTGSLSTLCHEIKKR